VKRHGKHRDVTPPDETVDPVFDELFALYRGRYHPVMAAIIAHLELVGKDVEEVG
jgi:Fic family protein